MPKYKKRADGRYLVQIKIGYLPSGKPKYKSIYGKTVTDLENNVAEFKSLKNKGIIIDDKNITVKAWVDMWVETYKSNIKENSKAMYLSSIKNHFSEIGDKQLSKLKSFDVQKVVNSLSNKPRAQEIFLLTIRQALKKAISNKLIHYNVADDIEIQQKRKPQKRALTSSEVQDILSLPLSQVMRLYISLMLYCGLRRGEAWGLMRKDIDLDNDIIHIVRNATYSSEKKATAIGSPKTKTSIRDINIPTELHIILGDFFQANNDIYLFTLDGKIFSAWQMQDMWLKFIAMYNNSKGGTNKIRAIASDITPHIFRHTYATMLYNAGVDIKTAQYLLGHSDIKVTLEIYTHLEDKNKIEAIKKLNSYISEKNIQSVKI